MIKGDFWIGKCCYFLVKVDNYILQLQFKNKIHLTL